MVAVFAQTSPTVVSAQSSPPWPVTSLHYTANGNVNSSGQYLPGADGFNLADVSSVSGLNSLPAGVLGLVWISYCGGVNSVFQKRVSPFIGDPKLFGFYVMDEPNLSNCPATNLKAEDDWIHAHVPGAEAFAVLDNQGPATAPKFGWYTPANSDLDLVGLDPYPVRSELSSPGYNEIALRVTAAEAAGWPLGSLVPVYQTFGGGTATDDAGGHWVLPTAAQEDTMLADWAAVVPTPVFDYAYSWGSQSGDVALSQVPALQSIFLAKATTFTLSGIVRASDGTPLNGTQVHVYDATTGAYIEPATMGAGGTYTTDLPTGSYKLYIQPNTAGYPDQWLGGLTFASATAITVSAATSQDITLVSTFTLSGIVRASDGTPLNGTQVHVYDATTGAYIEPATMGAGGTYTTDLPTGSYKLYIQPNTAGYPDQWLGGLTYASATMIGVNAATSQDITLVSTFTLSGIVRASDGTPLNGTQVHVYDATTGAYIEPATMGAGGTYTTVLPTGSYKLYIQPNTAGYPDQWLGGLTFASATTIGVNAATTQDITLVSTFTLSGIVRASDGTPLNGTQVHVYDATTGAYIEPATMGAGGTYTTDLPTGSYKLYIQPNTAGYPDQWLGGLTFASATAITVSAATSQDITLTP